jgi:hypothetical protein
MAFQLKRAKCFLQTLERRENLSMQLRVACRFSLAFGKSEVEIALNSLNVCDFTTDYCTHGDLQTHECEKKGQSE